MNTHVLCDSVTRMDRMRLGLRSRGILPMLVTLYPIEHSCSSSNPLSNAALCKLIFIFLWWFKSPYVWRLTDRPYLPYTGDFRVTICVNRLYITCTSHPTDEREVKEPSGMLGKSWNLLRLMICEVRDERCIKSTIVINRIGETTECLNKNLHLKHGQYV